MVDRSLGRRIFQGLNGFMFIIFSLSCIIPMVHVLAISLSKSTAVTAGKVTFWPVEFSMKSYEYILKNSEFWNAMGVSVERVVLGVVISMLLTILAAYPLSKSKLQFKHQSFFAWYLVITMLFSGGLVPSFMIVKNTHLYDTIWALVIPSAISVFNVLLLSNFFRNIPKEVEESAFIDGAGHTRILMSLYLQLSMPIIATLVVFAAVTHWNSWFDGIIYMSNQKSYPLQSYLQTILVDSNTRVITRANAELMSRVSDRTIKASQVFIAAIPILFVYPFMQKYFVSGMMIGAVKE
ncbi:putative aldouronate transport system permease protein [Paenibacillus taihuensis]|uniref:Putative aldouronate transport system permease protein n=1 Tax=Paenibacillus taihuensis TaxID=1156355 RepID=A0A3D9S1R4_9BACL|nr:carbohydrate ABC transporter permease [Paenibacillus taihuensis]REE86547.1 putative aldouronate transport system permease protein [Paenibacillus taihuensis]